MGKHFKGAFESKRGLHVEVRNEKVDAAIRSLNRKVKLEGIIRDLRKREYYEPPSVKRRRKQTEARRRVLKAKAKNPQE